jgi:hypothetical protein
MLEQNDEPIQPMFTVIVGDGAPVYMSSKLDEEALKENGTDKHSLAKWFFGGLHF